MAAAVVEPVILSASRATDVPAFYAEWFMNRIRAGFFAWTNPFNPAQAQTVSTAKTRAIVFWSKHPAGILAHLDELDRRGFRYYFQYTLNDYEAEGFEPRLPPLAERIALFRRLARASGQQQRQDQHQQAQTPPTPSLRHRNRHRLSPFPSGTVCSHRRPPKASRHQHREHSWEGGAHAS